MTPAAEAAAPAPGDTSGGLFEQSQAAAAPTSAPSDLAVGAAKAPPFTLNGYARGDVFVGKMPDVNAAEMKANYGELSLQLRTAKSVWRRRVRRRAHPLRAAGQSAGHRRRPARGLRQRVHRPVRSASRQADHRLGAGRRAQPDQQPDAGRLPHPLAARRRHPPRQRRRARVPAPRAGAPGRRLDADLSRHRAAAGRAPAAGVVRAPRRFRRRIFATASSPAALHLELAAFDASISYLRGYAPLPGLTLATVTFDMVNPGITVSRTAYDQQVIGLDFSTALGDVATLRGEAAYRRPFDYQNRPYAARPDLQYALGADHNFGTFSVIGQYLGRYVFDWQKEPGTTQDPGELTAILSQPSRMMDFAEQVNDGGQRRAGADQPDPVLADRARAAHRHASLRVAARRTRRCRCRRSASSTSPPRSGWSRRASAGARPTR